MNPSRMIKRISTLFLAVMMVVGILPSVPDVKAAGVTKGPEPNFVVIDDTDIAISVGDEGEEISSAILSVVNEASGKESRLSGNSYADNAAAFDASRLEQGVYSLSSLSYIQNEEVYETDLNASRSYRFGVGCSVVTAPDAYLVDKESEVYLEYEKALASEPVVSENRSLTKAKANGKIVIVLDPGHDDTHLGARGIEGAKEEEYTLKIATYAYEKLRQNPNVEVYMTRYTGACPFPETGATDSDELRLRVEYAASKNADLFASIHLNASGSGAGLGAEVYYPNENYIFVLNRVGKAVATNVLNKLSQLGLVNRGVKVRTASSTTFPDGSPSDYYAVIRRGKLNGLTSIIIEHCFIDNHDDFLNHLFTEEQIKALGEADADGILESLGILETSAASEFSDIFDAKYYRSHYSDLSKYSETDVTGLFNHFLTTGLNEGRQAHPNFNVTYYYANYTDLQAAYGKNYNGLARHYILIGKSEGRVADKLISPVTPEPIVPVPEPTYTSINVYNGVDYSEIYEFNEYVARYPDLKSAFGTNPEAGIRHFVNNGMNEGRAGRNSFDPKSYFYYYPDLRKAYGTNWKSYYSHYQRMGKKEGRKTSGVTEMRGYTTVYNGVDYANVYNFNYYISKYPDLKKAFAYNDAKAVAHFVNCGMNEARQASESFNLTIYKNNYTDLRDAFGNNNQAYYRHYMSNGIREGRSGSTDITQPIVPGNMYKIMGGTGTTLEKMVKFYNANATYPEFYKNSDAPTIEDYCKIVLEESAAEGVKAEVVFCQSMLETGFMRFGGDVKIEQFNFSGLGATGGGEPGNVFPSVRIGMRAQVQHLKAYASTAPLNRECVDVRFDKVTRNCAPYVEYLGVQENPGGYGWAVGAGYGAKIINLINKMNAM